ncbi:hypothetical protein SAMN02745751_03711 [Dethiosulfatibacter aminovorans DSM 17477]|uniref:Uncharacterized protein n=1 Tax=Dethiosulfatibacter aminovorans DSM 17477 TaxID=1121476 RepID=A0A1M6N8Z4_9FIRM|nr:hypothetical protein [Dethiosulfatibacter aminovorans]SHJ92094.1 hypothetical protein SAMN02745751_03711 [Dethiosulfatibacter aminovorans DSM 17477]
MNKLIVYLCIIFLLCGCTIIQTEPKVEEPSGSYGLNVKATKDKYSLTMSSVPGLPIEVNPHSDMDISDIRLLVTCNSGQFVSWSDSGETTILGDEFILPFEEVVLYWRPDNEEDSGTEEKPVVIIGTYNKNLGMYSLIYTGSIKEKEGYYSIDFDVRPK